MKRRLLILVLLLVATAGALGAHDLFLKPDSYFVAPGSTLEVRVLNGTFSSSDAAVARDRIRDLAVVSPSGRTRPDTSAWAAQGDTSVLTLSTGESGTYLLGASLLPRELALEAKDFNEYLTHDGLPDVLEARRTSGELDRPARERYSKHVKALVQVGDRRTEEYQEILHYPAELIALDNPYTLRSKGVLRVRALVDGRPVPNQLVVAGNHKGQRSVRTDSSGVARLRIGSRGAWYVKFIHMERATGDTTVDYVSKWATLTFGVR
jgi:uncharacterized GH25 family protein